MAQISVTVDRTDPPAGVVALSGELDAYAAPRLRTELGALFDDGLAVVIDLSRTVFVDSQALSVLLAGRLRAEGAALGFTVVLPPEPYTQVHRILDITGLHRSFAVYPALPEAMRGARRGLNAGHARAA